LIEVFLSEYLGEEFGSLVIAHPPIQDDQTLLCKNALSPAKVPLLDPNPIADFAHGVGKMLNKSFGFHE
jgi:hypothetical protein